MHFNSPVESSGSSKYQTISHNNSNSNPKYAIRIPPNYLKKYFAINIHYPIPNIQIQKFYQKVHRVRAVFIQKLPNLANYLFQNYPLTFMESNGQNSQYFHYNMQKIVDKNSFVLRQSHENDLKKLYYGQQANHEKNGYGIYAQYGINCLTKVEMFYFFEGHFENDFRNGPGIEWVNNKLYIGNFVNNEQYTRDHGIYIYSCGDIYIGSIKNDKRNGAGVVFKKKKNNNQYCKYQCSKRPSDYSSIIFARWQNDKIISNDLKNMQQCLSQITLDKEKIFESKVNMIIQEQSIYYGDLLEIHLKSSQSRDYILKQGKGMEIFCNEDVYKGNYLNNKPHGYGQYNWANKDFYLGQFQNGVREGNGKWIGYCGQIFQGEYKNDKRNGYGVYKWPNGDEYEGEFVDDLRQGNGKMLWTNGEIYVGQWKNGLQNGQGEIRIKVFSSSLYKKSNFVNGVSIEKRKIKMNSFEKLISEKQTKNLEPIKQILQRQRNKSDTIRKNKTDQSVSSFKYQSSFKNKSLKELSLKSQKQVKLSNSIKASLMIQKNKTKSKQRQNKVLQSVNSTQPQIHFNHTNYPDEWHSELKLNKLFNEEKTSELQNKNSMILKKTQAFKMPKKNSKKIGQIIHYPIKQKQQVNKLGKTLLEPIKWRNVQQK